MMKRKKKKKWIILMRERERRKEEDVGSTLEGDLEGDGLKQRVKLLIDGL